MALISAVKSGMPFRREGELCADCFEHGVIRGGQDDCKDWGHTPFKWREVTADE